MCVEWYGRSAGERQPSARLTTGSQKVPIGMGVKTSRPSNATARSTAGSASTPTPDSSKGEGLFPRESHEFSDVDIDPSFPEKPPTDGATSLTVVWLSPTVKDHESWVRTSTMSLPLSIFRRDTIGEHSGPWLAVHAASASVTV
jgi:hypothetical protein